MAKVTVEDLKLTPQSKFFPVKDWLGRPHKQKGAYIDGDRLVFFNCSGYRGENVQINIQELSQIVHIAKFKFMFLIVAYAWEAVNSIVFAIGANSVASLPVGSMPKDVLLTFIRELLAKNGRISVDPVTSEFAKTGSVGSFTKNYMKAVWRGMRVWLIILVLILFFVIILGVTQN